MASKDASLLSPDTYDALFASLDVPTPPSPVSAGRATVSRRTQHTLATSIDPLEERLVQSADPVMGPIYIEPLSTSIERSPEEEAQITSLQEQINTLEGQIVGLQPDMDSAMQALGLAEESLGTKQSIVTDARSAMESAQTSLTAAISRVDAMKKWVSTATTDLNASMAAMNQHIQNMNEAKRLLDLAQEAYYREGSRMGRMMQQEVVDRRREEYINRERQVRTHQQNLITPRQRTLDEAKAALKTAEAEKVRAEQALAPLQASLDVALQDEAMAVTERDALQAGVDELAERINGFQSIINDLKQQLADLDAVFAARLAEEQAAEALATELAASVQAALEAEAARIKYAKMFVSIENLSTGDMRLHIRFRNPGEQTIVTMRIGGTSLGDMAATAPTADGTFPITLRSGDGYGGEFVIQLQDGQTREVLTEVYGTYDRYSRSASIGTTQTPFDTEEAGMLPENPVTPALHLGRMDKGTVLLVVETPFDQFYIDTDMAGILSTAEGSVSGGTTFGLAQITVDTGRPTGYHTIRLYDRKGGQVIDTLTVYFDQPSRTLSLADPSDQYSGSSSIEETDLGQQQEAMQALQNIPLGVAYADIARNQRLNLYYQTEHLAAPYNLYIDADRMLDLLFATPQYVKYRPENIQQTIQQEWDNMGTYMEGDTLRHHYDYSHAQTNVELSKRQIVADFMGKLAVYEQGVSECVQAAVNIFIGITQGQPEEPLRQTYDAVYAQWSANGIIKSLEGIGMTMPNTWTLRMAAKEVFYDHWEYIVQTAGDVVQVRAREEYFLQLGLLKKATGEWEAASDRNSPVPLPADIDADQLRLATRIRLKFTESNDPRIRAIRATRLDEAALRIATIATGNTTEREAEAASILADMAHISAADAFVEAHEPAVQTAILSAGQNSNLSSNEISHVFTWVKQDPALLAIAGFDGISLSSLASAAGNLIGGLFRVERTEAAEFNQSKHIPDFAVRQDTPVGKIFLSILQQTEGINDVSVFAEQGKYLQKMTNIPWYKTAMALEVSGQSARDSNLRNLFIIAGYGTIFSGESASDTPHVLSVMPNKTEYSAGEVIQVRFDVAVPEGYSIDHAFAYAVYNGQQLSNVPVSAEIDEMFVRIPVSSIQSQLLFSHDGPVPVQIKIAVWLKREDGLGSQMVTAGGLSQVIEVPENSISLTQEEMNVIDMNIPPEFSNNQKLIQALIQDYFLGTDPNNKLVKVGNGWQAAVHGTSEKQCKEWLDDIFVKNATGIDLPKNDPTNLSKWITELNGTVLQIANSDLSTNFESAILNGSVIAGDIVQMRGDFDGDIKTSPSPHTMLIGKIQLDGIWVLDTNFGQEGEWMDDDGQHPNSLNGIIDENGVRRGLTPEEIENNVHGTLWYQEDNTIRYHFMNYVDLNREVISASIYRLN